MSRVFQVPSRLYTLSPRERAGVRAMSEEVPPANYAGKSGLTVPWLKVYHCGEIRGIIAMAKSRKLLGAILIEMGVITEAQLNEALALQQENHRKLGEILVEMEAVSPRQITEALGKQFEMTMVDLRSIQIPAELIELIPVALAKEHNIIPVDQKSGCVTIATSDPLDLYALDNLRFILNREIECVLAPSDEIEQAIKKYYGIQESTVDSMLQEFTESDITFVEDDSTELSEGEKTDAEDAPVIKLVTLIIGEAVRARASDIHIEPLETKLRIRYRVDGVCHEVDSPPKRLQGPIISRIKIMADMDIAEKRRPQDGRIRISLMGRELDLRVSCLPANHGESVVMRILDKESLLLGITDMGFEEVDYKRFTRIIKRPNGILLVTGPTGSGKTTTLYGALSELNKPDRKIITAEDPVEYHLSGVNQCLVKREIGLTFPRILRAMMRQAPDIILVGEIRDHETAEIAIQAALTGHLVFSTLHTNDAPSAITRLIDMSVPPFLVASSIQAVMGQRLVRVLCPKCKEPYEYDKGMLQAIGMKPEVVKGVTLYHDVGCEECKGVGFKGRLGIFELMEMDHALREMAFTKTPYNILRRQAINSGMTTLQEDGARKVLKGITTVEEIIKLTHEAKGE